MKLTSPVRRDRSSCEEEKEERKRSRELTSPLKEECETEDSGRILFESLVCWFLSIYQ